jgi:hypothetical protein
MKNLYMDDHQPGQMRHLWSAFGVWFGSYGTLVHVKHYIMIKIAGHGPTAAAQTQE